MFLALANCEVKSSHTHELPQSHGLHGGICWIVLTEWMMLALDGNFQKTMHV